MRRTHPHRWTGWKWWPAARWRAQAAVRAAALDAAGRGWPVVPGARLVKGEGGPCSCGDIDCPVPGGHPDDPPLEAATTDARMVGWWWEQRTPGAPVVVATGARVCAVSLPDDAGVRLLDQCAAAGVEHGPVLAAGDRYVLLVAPYTLEELGGLLAERGSVPSSLRYHGPGGYLVLPPARTGDGPVSWVCPPPAGACTLPEVGTILSGLIAAAGTGKSDRWRRGMHQRSDLFKE